MKVAVKVLWISLAWLLGWTLFYLLNLQTAYSADLPGKKVFLDYKCNACHEVKKQNIAKEEKAKLEEEEEDEDEEEEKVEPPDLSNLGNKESSKVECTEDFLDKWLRKQVANNKGAKHKKLFKGTPEERKILVDWLLALCPSK